jgi:hypothetical protein
MALPELAAAAGTKLFGSIVGALGQNEALNRGLNAYNSNVNQGTQTLKAGQQGATAAFDPYSQTGATANQGQLDAVQNRTQAAQPSLSNTSAGGIASWLNPMATWQQNQATKAATASGVATGATGGGMQRAISADANTRAQGSWNDAYNQMLQANNQNFGQQQQQYANQTGFDQSQIDNLGGIAQRGLSATSTNQGLQQGYNQGINQNFGNMANTAMGVNAVKGQLWNDTATSVGNSAGNMFSSWLGGK